MKLIATPIAVSIHPEGVNPIFGDGVTHISVQDEAAGAFIELRQPFGSSTEEHELRFDIEELELVAVEARKLIEAQPKETT